MPDVDSSMDSDDTIAVRPLLNARDVARILGIGERTVWRMTSRAKSEVGAFPHPVRIGRSIVRWRWKDVETYLDALS